MMYVLNIVSPKSSHIIHSSNITESKQKDRFIASYFFEKFLTQEKIPETLVPSEIFMERTRVHYEHYYFYWGKTIDNKAISVNASGFNKLSQTGEFFYCSPSSIQGCNNGLSPIDKYNKNLYFAVWAAPDSFLISIYHPHDFKNPITVVYKRK